VEETRRVKTRSRLNGSDFPTGAVRLAPDTSRLAIKLNYTTGVHEVVTEIAKTLFRQDVTNVQK
jgi:hypothetical protein